MVDTKYSELIAQYLSEDITVENKEKLMTWVEASQANKAYFDDLSEVWNLSDKYDELELDLDIGAAWNKLDSSIIEQTDELSKPTPKTVKIVQFRKKWWSVAAAIALLISVGGYWWSNMNANVLDGVVVATNAQEKIEHLLPDGSQVWLNSNSELSYEKDFNERIVHLTGEAFFEVVKEDGATFQIISGKATTTVLGTSFNVRAYPEEDKIEVAVETGVVELQESEKASNKVKLVAGNSGHFNKQNSRTAIDQVENKNAQAWRTKSLKFDDEPLSSVEITLERYFGVDIEIANDKILNCPFTVTEQVNPKLEPLLDALAFATDLEITKEKSGYRIDGVGCD